MIVVLNSKDYRVISNAITNNHIDTSTSVEIDGLKLIINFKVEQLGYYEDDYENGTGAFVCTEAVVSIKDISIEDSVVKVDFDKYLIEKLVKKNLTDWI